MSDTTSSDIVRHSEFGLRSREFIHLSLAELTALSRQRGLSLSAEEMGAIQVYFRGLGRNPSDAELETLAQTWSEHCKHKVFRAAVDHVEKDELGLERTREYKDLLKDTIVRATSEINAPWCLSVFKDNAGIVTYDGKEALALKVETHNHPSALEPYGGAGTGLGGVIRDIMGAGLGAKPIANTDVFCFAPIGEDQTATGLTTRRIFHGVVSGVRDYGNRMGIPTVSGAVYFDDDFRHNPLVFCGTLGLIPVDAIHKEVKSGDRIVTVGGRVGRDGIHGATFSSDSLTEGISSSVVQIGNPIVEKKTLDALMIARDRRLYRGITDCGAGGLSSAVGEMGAETGADVRLERVPLKYQGLEPWEIWLSESQERMVLAVPPEKIPELMGLFASEDVECADIGEFTADKRLKVSHNGKVIVDVDMDFLHDGVPKRHMQSFWSLPKIESFPAAPRAKAGKPSWEKALPAILAQPTVASKEWVVRQYDHEVQGRTVIKPFVGPQAVGPSDATVMMLRPDSNTGVAVSCGLNPHYSRWDPYWMAASAIDEAVRNLVAVGVRPDRIAILDNFCAGNPLNPEILGEVVRTSQACYDTARSYGTPFISGKDSLFNEFVDTATGKKKNIPTTLLVTAMAEVPDLRKTVSMDLKHPGNWLYVVGLTRDELGGSRYGIWCEEKNESRGAKSEKTRKGMVPRLDTEETWPTYERLSEAIQKGLVAACHDCSDGGLGVAMAEMAFGGNLGLYADLRKAPMSLDLKAEGATEKVLFSESNGRFVVEVAAKNRRAFLNCMDGSAVACVGQVRENRRVQVVGLDGKTHTWAVADLEKAWRGGIKP